MESELAVQLEQRVTERLAQAQESSLRQAASLRDHHRCLELAGCGLSTAAAGGGGGPPRPFQIRLPASNTRLLSVSLGETCLGFIGEPDLLGDFPLSLHRKEHLANN